MKYLLLLTSLLVGSLVMSQEKLPVKFLANEKTKMWVGQEWDQQYTPLTTKLLIEFDGTELVMTYVDGKEFTRQQVKSYKYNKVEERGQLKFETYSLAINNNGLTEYYIIEYFHSFGSTIPCIKIPYTDKAGEVKCYFHYQKI